MSDRHLLTEKFAKTCQRLFFFFFVVVGSVKAFKKQWPLPAKEKFMCCWLFDRSSKKRSNNAESELYIVRKEQFWTAFGVQITQKSQTAPSCVIQLMNLLYQFEIGNHSPFGWRYCCWNRLIFTLKTASKQLQLETMTFILQKLSPTASQLGCNRTPNMNL